VGSQAVKDAILQYQPLLGLHGHVHESPGAHKIGTTLSINPGSDYGDGILRGAIVDIDHTKGVRSWQIVQG
jgi:Icc-related predicted phosphoesterase